MDLTTGLIYNHPRTTFTPLAVNYCTILIPCCSLTAPRAGNSNQVGKRYFCEFEPILDFKLTQQAAIRWREYKLLTGDPGYPDYPIPIPPNETHRKV